MEMNQPIFGLLYLEGDSQRRSAPITKFSQPRA